VDLGIALVPEGRRLFPRLTVEETSCSGRIGPRPRAAISRNQDFCFTMFPRLAERRKKRLPAA